MDQTFSVPIGVGTPRRLTSRALADRPERIFEAVLAACPHCTHALGFTDQSDVHAYDHLDVPPLNPVVTRINHHRGACPCCHKRATAPAPECFDFGSPFGPSLCGARATA